MPKHAHEFLVVASTGSMRVHPAEHIIRSARKDVGSVFGAVTQDEALHIIDNLARNDDPGRDAPDTPWLAVSRRHDGSIVATCSTMLVSGFFASVVADDSDTRLIVGTNPTTVVRASGGKFSWDYEFLHRFARFAPPSDRTPFTGVMRIPGGETLRWHPGENSVTLREWCGPQTLPTPTRNDPGLYLDYVEAMDEVVNGLASRTGPLVVSMSGGLDSTFVAASLVRHAEPGRALIGLCHSPIATTAARPGWDDDDLPFARQMQEHYPGLIEVQPVRNDAEIHPLNASLEYFQRSGTPTPGVTNVPWVLDIAKQTQQLGASHLFVGGFGNATFSANHTYAAQYYLRRGRIDQLIALANPSAGPDRTWRGGLRSRVLRPLYPQTPTPDPGRWSRVGVRPAEPLPSHPTRGREVWLRMATGRLRSNVAAYNPSATPGVLHTDPFAARRIIELAASIEPAFWQRGAPNRGFARMASTGRLPDDVRLRRTRGGQGTDGWHVVASQFNRLDEALARYPASGCLDEVIDIGTVERAVAQLRTYSAERPPPSVLLHDLLRVLSLIEYVDWVEQSTTTAAEASQLPLSGY